MKLFSHKNILKNAVITFVIGALSFQNSWSQSTTSTPVGQNTITPTAQNTGTPPPTNGTDNRTNDANNVDLNKNQDGNLDDNTVMNNEEYERLMETKERFDRNQSEYMIDDILIFGSELFAGANTRTGSIINRPTPADYILGPGDQLLIDITGINLTTFSPTVQPDGHISLREFGRVNVAGRSIDEAREIVKSRLNSNNFSIDRGSTLEFSITNIRSFTVNVMGEVRSPGAKLVGTFNTVLDVLNMAGGITSIGTFRHVQLIRDKRVYAEIDLYEMIINGDYSQNYYLKDDDLIQVRPYKTRVALTGAVKRQRWFEVKDGETLADVMAFSGGYNANAYTNIVKAIQYTDEQKRVRDIKWEDLQYFNPANGDKYIVDVVLDRLENRVAIQGAVFRPGDFELETTPTLKALIAKAEGIKEEAFTNRAYLTRTNTETGAQENITIDLQGILYGSSPDITLQREDVLTIRSMFDLADQSSVTIAGKIRSPGTFNFYYGMTVEDLILLGDGFTDGADYQLIQISRRVKNSDRRSNAAVMAEVFTISVDPNLKMTDKSFRLEPYDVVSVMSLKGYVKPVLVGIEGEVMYPGTYPLLKRNDKITDLLKRAGGLTEMAYVKGSSLKRIQRAITDNEKLLDKYRKDLRVVENKAEMAEQLLEGDAVIIGESKSQLDPVFVTIDLDQILKKPESSKNIILNAGDVLSVPTIQQTVEIRGQVGFPTIAVYEEGKDVLDYIKIDAGGFGELAHRKKTTVEYLNGRSSTKKLFGGFPEVEPGSVIYVPAKAVEEKQKFDIQSIIALTSSIVSTATLIIAVLRMSK